MIHLTDDTFEHEVLKSSGLTLVDFYAEWCGPCKMLAPILDEAQKSLPNVKFVKADIDICAESASNYGIMSVPTLMLFKDGEKLTQVVGVVSKEKLLDIIKKSSE